MKDKWKQRKMQELACKLRSLEVPLEIPEANRESELIIWQVGGLLETRAFDLDCGGTGFTIELSITIGINRFAISHFALELPWDDSSIRWLDPVEIAPSLNVYRFPGTGGLELSSKDVINHFADLTRMWSRGQSLQGLLVGIGSEPIPNDFGHGRSIPGFITVVDQFESVFRSPISLFADRSWRFAKHTRKKPRRRSLFECRDVDGPSLTPQLESEKANIGDEVSDSGRIHALVREHKP
jgi:hypothetical protein